MRRDDPDYRRALTFRASFMSGLGPIEFYGDDAVADLEGLDSHLAGWILDEGSSAPTYSLLEQVDAVLVLPDLPQDSRVAALEIREIVRQRLGSDG